VRPSVRPEQTLLARYLAYLLMELDLLLPLMDFGARINASNFGVKRSRVKVTVASSMLAEA